MIEERDGDQLNSEKVSSMIFLLSSSISLCRSVSSMIFCLALCERSLILSSSSLY
jgi:hypothetical protein